MGKSLLVYGKDDSIEEIKSKIESISDSDIHEVAVDILNPSKLSTLIYR
jgi:bisphosphoglycerate-dependent phosphoglycerate mutase